ncbi:hypothetical protein B0T19DRAFT_413619 [Cercophora scortea]|uniref:Protein kinase domain-containing protein n=1 Tax=Cercophora scortea TaxID=314031 RepID=A0AAE0MGD8_9PEZI|nr:hypothetical protein B0T19DRAFT_413619 [Cercophora scortea]
MESYLPTGAMGGGLALPSFQRRLSRLYNDTKKSSDFVKDPPVQQHSEADPEIKALHRKLRIQKDRLVSWGLEWSDPNQSSPEVLIDSSLSKAGLSEVVGSIMSTIKEILAEAEPLWHSSRRLAGERVEPDSAPKRGEKIQLVVWDRSRFEDLIRDLTDSIDTLYDLSRTRSSYAQSSMAARERLSKPSVSTEDLRPFESSRIQTPQQIDPGTLTNLRSMLAEPMTESDAQGQARTRDIVFMGKQAYSELMQRSGGQQPYAPLLLEYASFDSIYSMTGISPPMSRFEKLSAGLQTEPQRSPGSWTGLPRLLGYFEDMENSRFGLVYRFPRTFNPVSFEHLTQNPLYNLCSLADLLARPDFEPKLEAKFRLAANLANTVFDMHARGITHGNLVDDNISFCNAVGTDPEVSGVTRGEVDIRRPLISSFDLFSDPQSQDSPTPFSPYKHPLDPRNSAASPLVSNADSKTLDIYSLAMILLSIGLWTKLENLVPDPSSPVIPESVLDQLSIRCGTLYMKAVQACWNAVDQELTGLHSTEQIVSHVQFKTSRYLEACCILDGVSNLDERLGDDLGKGPAAETNLSSTSDAGPSKSSKTDEARGEGSDGQTEGWVERRKSLLSSEEAAVQTQGKDVHDTVSRAVLTSTAPKPLESETKQPSAKMRLYPQVLLSPDVVEQWNKVVMPQVNNALRSFYRKNPESVEISLESIGESPQKTKPTVLVVCTSVGKVRAILKKKLSMLFDGSTGFALKVCRGQVLRSRNRPPGRSMAKLEDAAGHEQVTAANPQYQERPQNGASIGAWIGDRHLPPVSFGGLIVVDDKPYGMTVHHMLDDPEQNDDTATAKKDDIARSMARSQPVPDLAAWYAELNQKTESEPDSSGTDEDDYACEFSDSDSDTFSESAITSDDSDDDEEGEGDDRYFEQGDVVGIEPGCGEGYIVTQPALDDVPEGFHPSKDTEDEDHLDSFSLGEVYASSGIRRREEQGMVHEIDWALFEFKGERLPKGNVIPRAEALGDRSPPSVINPSSVAAISTLPGLEVQCMARTSGLQTGLILPTLTSVKIYGRMSPSHTYQVSGTPSSGATVAGSEHDDGARRPVPMGIPGDSGAWVVDRKLGQICGHVLAWSERKRVAYICPMDVLLLDIAETLEADEIRLPSGEVLFSIAGGVSTSEKDLGHGSGGKRNPDNGAAKQSAGVYQRRGSRRNQSQRGSYVAAQQRHGLPVDDHDDDEDDECYDEGVEVDELARDVKQLRLSEQGVPLGMGKCGVT